VSWVGAASSSPQSGIIGTGGARISHKAVVPAGAGFLAVAVHPPSSSTATWTLEGKSYIKYDAIDIDGVAASPIGYASGTLLEPLPDAPDSNSSAVISYSPIHSKPVSGSRQKATGFPSGAREDLS
jgi:hypothetical protein